MAERNVTVRLRAITDQYKKAMGDASKATQGLVDKAGGMQALGGQMKALGGTLTRSVTLPMVALGGIATKTALDFDKTFVQMQALAGVAADEVAGLKDAVLDLAGDTGQAPRDLAEALYFIRSAGLDGQDALEALEMSAKGAAIGLGDAKTVADVLTSAMNSYGSEALSAAEATDALVKTAEQGKVEAAALAPQFGRLLPVAAELGIRFDEVGAGLAFLSKSSGSAELSATQLGAVMSKLLKPSEQGAKNLAAAGLSAEALRRSIADQGLLSTLTMLRDRLGDSGFTQFLEDQQAIAGALAFTGTQASEARGVFDELANSTGALSNSFGTWADSVGADNARAFAEFQVALVKIGDALAPLVADMAAFAAAAVGVFTALPEPLQHAVIAFGGLAAAIGPVMSIGGAIATSWGAMGLALDKAAISAYAAAGALGTLAMGAGALAAAAGAVYLWTDAMNDAKKAGKEQADTLRGLWDGLDEGEKTVDKFDQVIRILDRDIGSLSDRIAGSQAPWDADKRKEMSTARDEAEKFRDELVEQRTAITELATTMGITESEAAKLIATEEVGQAAFDDTTGAFDAQAAAAAALEQEIAATVDAFTALSDQLAAQFNPLFASADAMYRLTDAQEAAAKAAREHGADSKEAAEANRDVVRAAVANEQAQLDLRAAIEAGDVQLEDAIGTLDAWVAQGLINEAQAEQLANEFRFLAGAANAIPRSISVSVTANTASVYEELRKAAAAVQSFNSSNGTSINVYRGQGALPSRKIGGAVPGAVGQPVPIMAHGGEMVLSADIVDAIKNGRPTAGLPALATVGAGAGGGDTFVIHAASLEARQVAKVVVDAIETAKRGGY